MGHGCPSRLLADGAPGEEAAELAAGLPAAPGLRRALVSAEEDALKVPSASAGEFGVEEIPVPVAASSAARTDDRCSIWCRTYVAMTRCNALVSASHRHNWTAEGPVVKEEAGGHGG